VEGTDFKVGTGESIETRVNPSPTTRGQSDANWLPDLISNNQHRVWPWVVLCLAMVLMLCCALLIASHVSNANRKQMSDLDVLDNYKQGRFFPLFHLLTLIP